MKNIEANQRKFAKKDARNKRVENDALSDPNTLFGRAEKALGNGWFSIVAQNKQHRGEVITDVRARIGGKSVARILTNDIVIIDMCGSVYEILGSVSVKNAKELVKERRIPSNLLALGKEDLTEGGGIEFEDDADKNDEAKTEDDEINIDSI
jgi:translation initiation factor IF-1